MPANIYVTGNFKGGVGKSTTAQMLAYESAIKFNRRTLLIDLDPQGNASKVMQLTAENLTGEAPEYEKTIWDGIIENDLSVAIYNIGENLDIIPANIIFSDYDQYIIKKFDDPKDQLQFFADLVEPLREKYDSIYIDVPPTISVFSKSAMYVADWVILILQTQVKALQGGQDYIDYMTFFRKKYNAKLDVLGIIPFMVQKRDSVDIEVYETAKEMYPDHLLKTVVLNNGRLKRYDGDGITETLTLKGYVNKKDAQTHEIFESILKELDENEAALSI